MKFWLWQKRVLLIKASCKRDCLRRVQKKRVDEARLLVQQHTKHGEQNWQADSLTKVRDATGDMEMLWFIQDRIVRNK